MIITKRSDYALRVCRALKDGKTHSVREICEKGGAIFFSTHVLEVAEKLCDRVAIIKNGKIVINISVHLRI